MKKVLDQNGIDFSCLDRRVCLSTDFTTQGAHTKNDPYSEINFAENKGVFSSIDSTDRGPNLSELVEKQMSMRQGKRQPIYNTQVNSIHNSPLRNKNNNPYDKSNKNKKEVTIEEMTLNIINKIDKQSPRYMPRGTAR